MEGAFSSIPEPHHASERMEPVFPSSYRDLIAVSIVQHAPMFDFRQALFFIARIWS